MFLTAATLAAATVAFTHPLIVGDVDAHSAAFAIFADASATALTLELRPSTASAPVINATMTSMLPHSGAFRCTVSSLLPATVYVATVRLASGELGPSTRFATAGDATQVVTFAATSCLGRRHWPIPTLSVAAAHSDVAFMCFLGDTVYADGAQTLAQFRSVWREALAVRGFVDLFRSTSIVAAWDDHELNDDWDVDNTPPVVQQAARQAFVEALPARYAGGVFWRQLSFGCVDLFVLDTRSDRSPSRRQYVSAKQLEWLKTAVRASKAPFKFLLNSIPITEMSDFLLKVQEENQWTYSLYAAQRSELLAALEGVAGVMFLSGDLHFGGLFHVGRSKNVDASYGIFELLAGPGSSRINPAVAAVRFLRIFDVFDRQFTKLIDVWNFAKLRCDPATRIVQVEFVGDDGDVIWATEIDVSAAASVITHRGWSLRGEPDADTQEALARICERLAALLAATTWVTWVKRRGQR